jgi:hypothetical protein
MLNIGSIPTVRPLPWKQIRWTTSVPIDECIARMRAVARRSGFVEGKRSRSAERMIVLGSSFKLGYSGRWPGEPHLHGVFVSTKEGTVILGRFSPDAYVLAVGLVLVWIVFGAALSTVWYGPERVFAARIGLRWLIAQTPVLIVAGSLGIAAVARSIGWSSQCASMSYTLATICQAHRDDL